MLTDRDDIQDLLPTSGWLGKYMRLTNGLSACARFRFYAALCVMGAAVNNKVWIPRGTQGTLLPRMFPNPWVALFAPPGRGYKTSTINMACNILQKACPEVRIMADKITPEAIVKALSEPVLDKEKIRIGPRDAVGLIKAPEMSVFFGKQQYNIGLVSLICDLYDWREVWTSETIGRGKMTLRNVCISVIAGSAPALLQSMLPEDAFTGGFMSRFIIVEMPPTYYKRVATPKEPTPDEVMDLLDGLSEIANYSGEMQWTDDAKKLYTRIYEEYRPTGNEQYDAYKERETDHILKVGTLLALSEGRMELRYDDLNLACSLIRWLDREAANRIERMGTHPRMVLLQRILDLLRLHEVMSEEDLLRAVYRFLSHGEVQFYEALGILRKTGCIEAVGQKGQWQFRLKGGGTK